MIVGEGGCPVRLRAMEPEDLDLLYTIENEEELWDVSSDCTPVSRYALRRYLEQQPQTVVQAGELRLVVEEQETGNAVGLIDLTDIALLDGRAEVGIALLKACRGKGYGRCALRLIGAYARRRLHLRMLYARIMVRLTPMCQSVFLSEGYEVVAVLPEWQRIAEHYEDLTVFQKKL